MICKFCGQLNPAGARCCFCDNGLDGSEDKTASGRPSAAFAGLARLADEPASGSAGRKLWRADPELSRHRDVLDRAKLIWSIIIGAGVVLWVVYQLRLGCH